MKKYKCKKQDVVCTDTFIHLLDGGISGMVVSTV